MPNNISAALQRIVTEAGQPIHQSFYSCERPEVGYKSGQADFVTTLDKETEHRLMEELSKLLPGSGFIAEESAADNINPLSSREQVWVIDPIDGTTNFVHKIPFCAISVALYRNAEPVLGLVYNPILQDRFLATAEGAWHNDRPIRVAQNYDLAKALLATGIISFGKKEEALFYAVLQRLTTASRGFRRLGSAALDLCYVANGAMDVYYETGIHPWDVAAGAFLVTQAGGKVTDYAGTEDFLFARKIVAGGPLHTEVLSILQQHYQ